MEVSWCAHCYYYAILLGPQYNYLDSYYLNVVWLISITCDSAQMENLRSCTRSSISVL